MKNLIITKVRDVKTPSRGTSVSAGIDFYVPEDFEGGKLCIGEAALIPSGVKVRIPHGYMLLGGDKSGVATKRGLTLLAKVIDEDYTGEVHIHIAKVAAGSVDEECTTIMPGDKIAQYMLVPVSYCGIKEVTNDEYAVFGETERGDGGFGSTGDK